MKKQYPSFEMYLPVLNVGPEQTREFRYRLRMKHLNDERSGRNAAIRKLTAPSQDSKAYLVLPQEVRALQGRARPRVRRPTEAHVTELKEYVDEILPESWRKWTIRTPSLPLNFDRRGRAESLSIAGCTQALKARRLAKQVLASFYHMDRAPRDIWVNDTVATRPVIARAYGADSRELLYELGREIERSEDNVSLPHTAKLGGVVTNLIIPELNESESS